MDLKSYYMVPVWYSLDHHWSDFRLLMEWKRSVIPVLLTIIISAAGVILSWQLPRAASVRFAGYLWIRPRLAIANVDRLCCEPILDQDEVPGFPLPVITATQVLWKEPVEQIARKGGCLYQELTIKQGSVMNPSMVLCARVSLSLRASPHPCFADSLDAKCAWMRCQQCTGLMLFFLSAGRLGWLCQVR